MGLICCFTSFFRRYIAGLLKRHTIAIHCSTHELQSQVARGLAGLVACR